MIKKPSSIPPYGGSITIQDWMVRLYHLQGDNLIVYATIHSFSKDGNSRFTGSLKYLSFWTGRSKPTILKSLAFLLDHKLIEKFEKHYTQLNQDRHYCEYWTTFSRLPPDQQKTLLKKSE